MSEATAAAEEENKKKTREEVKPPLISHNLEPSSSSAAAVAALMDLDFADLEPSWPFDQIPTSPVLISAVDQPFSPLWAFADASDDRNFRISADFSRISTCNLDSAAQNIRQQEQEEDVDDNNNTNDNNNKKKLPAPFLGFTPLENLDLSCIMKERMTKALRVFREMSEQTQILAQIWAPVKNGNRCLLTTAGQPFVLGPHSHGLNHYRAVSLMYKFAVDGEFNAALGLPGRVFRQKLPEWTPNVQYYSSKEYPRVIHAKNHNVRGTLALPVFEPLGQSCIGVLELIMTSEKINYAPEVDKVCKALEAVNLKSSEILDHPNIQICNEGRQNALAEILDVLTAICETYKLPLAQTWIPCMHRSVLANGGGLKKSCSSFDGSCMGQVCMSTTDVALYVVDARMWGFRDACAEHHLQKGQGVVGRAFLSHGLCFCRDISLFRKIEYPLVHYARMFKLTSSFAICLRSRHTGDDDYVLEFFLPPSVTDNNEQLNMVDCILSTMKQDLQNLMVASGRTLEEERRCMEIVEVSMDENRDFEDESILSSKPLHDTDAMTVMLPQLNSPQQLQMETDPGKSVIGVRGSQNGKTYAENKETKKTSERKRGKAEKQISLEVLQQYFAGSLKDAAKALGVCPTTMKRICRQHGISRWPSRKINKVNRSLTKLKRVIESVQGADAAFSLTSLAPPTIPGPVGPVSWPAGLNGLGTCQEQSPLSYLSDPADEASELPHAKPKSNELTNGRASSHEERTHEPNGFVSKTSPCSREVSTGTSTSHGSCYGSPGTESNLQNGQFIPNFHEHTTNNGNGLMFQPKGEPQLSPGYSVPDPFLGENPNPQELFGGMLVEDAGSSKDLKNLCPLAANANVDEAFREPRWTNHPPTPSPKVAMSATDMAPRFPPRNDTKVVTIKATFREDIIRFRFSLSSNIVELREEVAKRLKLEVGTFEIKYLDDDHEWVLIAYDSHLQECLDISNSSGNNMIRLLIQDISGHIGSSCESTGDRDGF